MLDFARQFAPLRQEILDAIAEGLRLAALHPRPAGCRLRGRRGSRLRRALRHRLRQRHRRPLAGAGRRWHRHKSGCPIHRGDRGPRRAILLAGVAERWVGSDAVVTTPFSFFATASSILRTGARPIFADIDPRTFNLSPESVAEILNGTAGRNVKAVLPVHLYGQCADWDGFSVLQRDHPGLLLIEDAAQAFGAAWTSASQTSAGQPATRPAGSLGDAAAFSFYPTKNLAAMGDAGLVTTSSAEIDRRARSLRAHGMTRRYFHDEVGGNSRLDELQAAVLNVKLRHIDEWNQQRRDRAACYDQLFREAGLAAGSTTEGVVLPYTDPRATHVFHQYVIRAPRRDALRDHLTAHEIGSEIYYPVPIHLQAALRDLGYKPGDFPNAERAAAEVLALPLYPELRDDEQQTVVAAIRDFYA